MLKLRNVTNGETLNTGTCNCNSCGEHFPSAELVALEVGSSNLTTVLYFCRKGCVPMMAKGLHDVTGIV